MNKIELNLPTYQLINGELKAPDELCLGVARRTFAERSETDTNPVIVQMVLQGRPIPHWYYRSDEWVDQPYYKPSEFVQPYVGPVNEAMAFLYGEGTYVVDEEMTSLCRSGLLDF